MADTTQQGIAALKSGNRAAARQLLAAAIKENPNNILAWLWLSGAVDKYEERAACLRQVLRIDPDNTAALKGLRQLEEQHMRQSGAAAAPPMEQPAEAEPSSPDEGFAPTREISAPEAGAPEAGAHEAPASESAAAKTAEVQDPLAREASAPEEPAPPAQDENHSPWATAQSAADSVASAVYGLRAELAAQAGEAASPVEAAEDTRAGEEQAVEEPTSAIDQTISEEPPTLNEAVETASIAPSEAEAAAQAYAPPAAAPAPQSYRTPAAAPAYYSAEPAGKAIFRTRPSVVPALIAFWVFFFGSVAAANILSQANMMAGLIFGLVIGFLLELVIVYIAIRNLRIRYELTSRHISLPHHGKQVQILIPDIFHAECQQTFLQRLVGLGDIRLDAIVGGELARLRMRDVPQCDVRAQQIMYLVKDLK